MRRNASAIDGNCARHDVSLLERCQLAQRVIDARPSSTSFDRSRLLVNQTGAAERRQSIEGRVMKKAATRPVAAFLFASDHMTATS
jgi:hypothetical protein